MPDRALPSSATSGVRTLESTPERTHLLAQTKVFTENARFRLFVQLPLSISIVTMTSVVTTVP